jgi:uncharacterized sporulation protein YeaH/YhbH (DUF444 family)
VGQLIDRRLNGKNKSAVNRQRFIRRFKQQIKKAVNDSVTERSITNIDSSEKINIPARDISEPVFSHGEGGSQEMVHPGNTDFVTGDKIKRPPSGGSGSGSEASKDGEGLDDFGFELSREEFLEFFFEDLELPDLVKTQLASIVEHKQVRAGYTNYGIPTNINVVRSLKGALARRLALGAPLKRRLHDLEIELAELQKSGASESTDRRNDLEQEISELKRRIKAIPFIDTFDLRFNNHISQPIPSTRAVMFCLMDVSGSMDQARKDIAKRFFILLYLFLTRTYETIDLVFIRHHTIAKEVDEDEFFHSRETGGTVVSSALELMYEIIRERYPSHEWNIYAAQASDGDNWHDDSPLCRSLLAEKIMPLVQYFAYVEIMADRHQRLWTEYEQIRNTYDNFAMQDISSAADIFPVFRKLFRKQTV